MASVELNRKEKGIVSLRLNRPQALNALDWQAMERFGDLVERLHQMKDLRALIVDGAGRAFCSGGDLYELHQFPGKDDGERLATLMGEALDRLEDLPVPTIAAIEGPALGGGAEIALACDLRLMAEGAAFGMMHVRLGITPAWGGGQRLLRTVGYARAMAWLATARVLSAREAHRHGVALEKVAAGEAYPRALELAIEIARHDPGSIRAVKRLLLAGRRGPYQESLALERALFAPLWAAEPHLKAADRFVSGKKGVVRREA